MADRRTIIGVDLDNTALQYSEGFWADLGRQDGVADIAAHIAAYVEPQTYDFDGWPGFPGAFKERHLAAVDAGLYRNMVAKEGASEVLWRLSDEGYHNRVVTARFVGHHRNAKVVADTAANLDEQNIPYRDLIYTADKADIYADIWLDDAPKNILKLREAQPNSRVIIFDASYNRHLDGERVHNWYEVYEAVTGKPWSA